MATRNVKIVTTHLPPGTGPARLGAPYKGGGLVLNATLYEDFTPRVNNFLALYDRQIVMGLLGMGKAMKEGVKNSYKTKRDLFPQSTTTMQIKRGATGLKDTGRLESAIEDSGGIEIIQTAPHQYTLHVFWDFPDSSTGGIYPEGRADKKHIYVWTQEFGSANMKRRATKPSETGLVGIRTVDWQLEPRPFFVDGLHAGAQAGLTFLVSQVAPLYDMMTQPGVKKPSQMLGVLPTLKPGIMEAPFYFVPPTMALAYIGAGSDLMGVWSGSFTAPMIFGWTRQMAWGQTGITKKTQRRKFRKGIWSEK